MSFMYLNTNISAVLIFPQPDESKEHPPKKQKISKKKSSAPNSEVSSTDQGERPSIDLEASREKPSIDLEAGHEKPDVGRYSPAPTMSKSYKARKRLPEESLEIMSKDLSPSMYLKIIV